MSKRTRNLWVLAIVGGALGGALSEYLVRLLDWVGPVLWAGLVAVGGWALHLVVSHPVAAGLTVVDVLVVVTFLRLTSYRGMGELRPASVYFGT
jgi:hypothetical protein